MDNGRRSRVHKSRIHTCYLTSNLHNIDLQAEVKQLKREEDVSEYQAWVFGEEMPDERKKLFEAADNHTGAQDNHIQGLENTANDQALQIKQLMQERNAARNANQLSKGSG